MLDNESRDPSYRAQTQPGTTDHTGRIIPRGWLRAKQIDLTVAQPGLELKVSGDFLFLDRNTSGVITIRFNDPTEYGVPMGQFDMVEGVPIDRVWVSWAAQPGLVANIWYGYQARLKATSGVSDISDRAGRLIGVADVSDRAARLLGIVYGTQGQLMQDVLTNATRAAADRAALVRDIGYSYGASYGDANANGASTNVTIVAPGTNVNGMILWDSQMITKNGSGTDQFLTLLAKTSAPATAFDGDCLALALPAVLLSASSSYSILRLARPVFIAAGKGLYYRTGGTAETAGQHMALYTLF